MDRFGKVIRVGWSEKELLWLEAALTLRHSERFFAFRDIAEMTGRTHWAIQCKAEQLMSEKRLAEAIAIGATRRVMVSGSQMTHPATLSKPIRGIGT